MYHHHQLYSIIPMAPSSSSSSSSLRNSNYPAVCRHSPSATLDLLIFILVLFSGAFLIFSYFNYLFQSLSLILPLFHYHLTYNPQSQILFFALLVISFVGFLVSFEICYGQKRSRRCQRKECRGLKKALEFDLKLQGEELLRNGDGDKGVKDVNELPWKGGSEDNPDYECLRSELRKMAPPNGRAVLLFHDQCGCPVAKIQVWGPKRGRRHNNKNPGLSSIGIGGGERR